MKEGGKMILYIPPHIAYGDNPPADTIPANAVLIFEVELLQVYPLNIPETLKEIKAYRISAMDCGTPPVLPEDSKELSNIRTQADRYEGCVRDYYQLTAAQLQGLLGLAGDESSMRDTVLDSFNRGRKDLDSELAEAIPFLQEYRQLRGVHEE